MRTLFDSWAVVEKFIRLWRGYHPEGAYELIRANADAIRGDDAGWEWMEGIQGK